MAGGADGWVEPVEAAPVCVNTPEPYANAYRMGALNCHRICRSASLNSWLMIICWLTPKSLDGSSEKLEMDRFGLWSQSDSERSGDVENEADEGGLPEETLYNSWDVEPLVWVDW
jgi:hypothetical protein